MAQTLSERFAVWIDRRKLLVLAASVLVAIGGGYLASRMQVQASLTGLLPPQERSVRDLVAIQKRVRPFGTVQVLLESDDVGRRARAGDALARRLRLLPTELVSDVVVDDGATQRYGWDHRFLFATLDDLTAARDALKVRIENGKLDSNPLYIHLDQGLDAKPEDEGDTDRFDKLEKQLDELEQHALHPEPKVSNDGRMQLLTVQTTFAGSDARRAKILIDQIKRAIEATDREVGRGVLYGLTGNITFSLYEHDSVLDGMTTAALLTLGLCALALVVYYRRGRIVLAILWALAVGVAATFAFAWAVVGHLNVMTAFLFAIVIGNGINAGMILTARFLEEMRTGLDAVAAMPVAIAGTLRGTTAAMATAAAAYTSLLITDFRGFRHFGAIAGVGMLATWLAAYTVLPALLLTLARIGLLKRTAPPTLGDYLAHLVPKPRWYPVVIGAGAVITAVAAVIATLYVVHDPFTKDWRDLQSSTSQIAGARIVEGKIRAAFDAKSMLSGQAYQIVIAVDRRDQVAPLVAKLRAEDEAKPAARRWMKDARSLDDAIPPDQEQKIVVLREIDALISDSALQATLSDDERVRIEKMRPPNDVAHVTDADVPMEIAWPFVEKDGTRGKLVVVRGAARFNSFDVADRLEFASHVRALDLPPGALVAGEALVVADIIKTMERDTPKVIGFALVGSILTVIVVLGLRRHGSVTLACGMAGVVVMIAVCALLGLKVHFLDLIALPITIGIGIDYAVNLAARDREEGERGPQHLVRTTGSTVLLCSYTTAVGYGTLMLSANGGIRAFGLAALVGEIACITMALLVAPVLLALLRARRGRTPLHENTHSSATAL